MDFASAPPSVVKSIRQRDLLNTWLRLYAREQTAPAIWEYQPARLEEELSDLIYYTVDMTAPIRRASPSRANGTRVSSRLRTCRRRAFCSTTISGRGFAAVVMPVYHECVARGAARLQRCRMSTTSMDAMVAYERLLLPFADRRQGLPTSIASLKTICEDGGFEIKNLMRGNRRAAATEDCAP